MKFHMGYIYMDFLFNKLLYLCSKKSIPIEEKATLQQRRGIEKLREDMKLRYFDAPDLKELGNNAYRFVNAVSDFATHAEPRRKTANYRENMFAKTADGNPLIDKAYQLVTAA